MPDVGGDVNPYSLMKHHGCVPSTSTQAELARASGVCERSAAKAEEGVAGTTRMSAHIATPGCTGAFACALLFASAGFVMLYFGPMAVLRHLLVRLPAHPGWDWYFAMGVVITLSIVVLLPIWPPLCMASGLFFGFCGGSLLNCAAILSAAAVSTALGRSLLREPVRQWLESGDYPRVRRIMLMLEDEEASLSLLMLFRFLFIPMFIRNYGPSALHVPFWKIMLGSVPHSAWISVMLASVGATFQDLAELIREGKEFDFKALRWQQVLVLLVSFFVTCLLAVYAHRQYSQRLAAEEAAKLLPGLHEASSAASAGACI
mmetsp:Transcript_69587/g.148859  ORF Transcript_69587/g.148859 Transcript_69587/m.148859 type:complete len:317 (+) Transcript_69587:107-1057(+)